MMHNKNEKTYTIFGGPMKLNYKQLQAIDLYAIGMKGTDIAEQVGVIPGTLSRWRQDPEFMEAINNKAKACLKDSLPAIYQTLISKAKSGSYPHARLILDHLDNLQKNIAETSDQTLTFTWKQHD